MDLDKALVRGFSRLAILSLLRREDMRAYQLLKVMESLFEVKLSLSSFYTMLKELEVRGYISSTRRGEGDKIYSITEKGRRILAEAKGRLGRKLDALKEILGL